MKKIITALFFLTIGMSGALVGQTPQPTPPPTVEDEEPIRITSNLIRVDVAVTDRDGRPVKNLRAEDFEIYENGIRQKITGFDHITPRSGSRAIASTADGLGLQDDRDGLSLKDKIAVPTTAQPADPNSIRRTIVLVVDDIGLGFRSVGPVKRSLKKFIREHIREGDLVTIVTTGGASVLPGFTSDKKQLTAVAEKIKWGPRSRGGADYYDPIKPTLLEELSDARGRDVGQVREETALLEDIELARQNSSAAGTIGALHYIIRGMRNLPGRKALVLFSEGFPLSDRTLRNTSSANETETPAPSANNQFGNEVPDALRSLTETANRAQVVIYPIDPRGLQVPGMANSDEDIRQAFDRNFKPGQTDDKRTTRDYNFRQSQESLRVLAEETGGFAVVNQNDLDRGLEKIIDDQSYYLLSFESEAETIDAPRDIFENISVKLKDPDLRVRYRNTYYSENSRAAGERALTAREKVGQALAYPFRANEIGLRLYSITGSDPSGGEFVRFLINIPAADLEFKKASNGMRAANFDLLAITLDEKERPVHQFSQNFNFSVNEATYKNILKKGFVYVLPVFLKGSGTYHFRAAIHDSATGRVGAAAKFLETPKFEKKRLWVSNLILTGVDGKQERTANLEDDKQVYTDTTRREFSPGTDLVYGAVVYNAELKDASAPDLSVRTRLIRDSEVISETPFAPVPVGDQKDPQRIDLSGSVRLDKRLAPGNYIFQVIVRDNRAGKKHSVATQWVDLEVSEK